MIITAFKEKSKKMKPKMNKYFLLILLLFVGANTENVSPNNDVDVIELTPVAVSQYNFINYQYNKIQIPGADSSRIKLFYQKLDKLLKEKEGQINILHLGGSHVQADMFSHKVRQNLDAINYRFQSPRGFIFPFSVAKTNNPTNYKVYYEGEWNAVRNVQKNREISVGMGGIAVYTSDPNARIRVALNPSGDSRWNFNRLRLLGYTEEEGDLVTPVLYYNGTVIESYFDFISNSYLFELPELADSFEIGFVQKDSTPHPFIVTGFLPEKDTPGIVYHAIGVNGASVPSYLNCEFFEDELPLISPDLVIFGLGINDAAEASFTEQSFIQNYNSLLRMIEHVNPNCAFLFITNNDSYKRIRQRKYAVNQNGLIAKDAFYKIAEENQGAVWDQFSLMGGLQSMSTWQANSLAQNDKLHFTRAGYELLGDLLYNALVDFYLQNDIE